MFVDIHSHVIPGIDDGAQNQEISNDMLRIAHENGTRHIIATPHNIPGSIHQNFEKVIEKCNDLNQVAMDKQYDLTIHSGCEVFLCPELPELYKNGELFTLSSSRYMLIELPMLTVPPYTDSVLYDLQLMGIVPIIAHPERNKEIQKNPDLLLSYIKRNILGQANAGSITGLYGKETQKVVLKMVKNGWIHFVASDAHTNRGRTPDLSKAANQIVQLFGNQIMEDLFINNGIKLLNNEIIEVNVLSQDIGKLNMFNRLFRKFIKK